MLESTASARKNFKSDARPSGKIQPSARLPIVICLDVSGSMLYRSSIDGNSGKTRLEHMNSTIAQLLTHLNKASASRAAVEVAFLAFTDKILLKSDFQRIMHINRDAFWCDPSYAIDTHVSLTTASVIGVNQKERRFDIPSFSVSANGSSA